MIRIRRGRMHALAKDARMTASEIEECIPQFKDAGFCLAQTVFDVDQYGSVPVQINLIRGELGRDGVVVDELEDATKRIQRGPSNEELEYIARVLDSLSAELDKLSK